MRDNAHSPTNPNTHSGTNSGTNSGTIQSLERAIRVLSAFTLETPEWGVRELSLHLGLPKSVVHRVVQTLAQGGLLEQSPTSQKYRVGLRAFEVGQLYLVGNRFHREALNTLRQMAAESTYTCYLGILDGADAVALAVEYGSHPVRIVGSAGDRFPAHAVAFGKAILAGLPDAEVLVRLGPGPLPQLTPNSVTNPQQVLAELGEVRRLGYAVSHEETFPGVASIGAAVLGDGGRPVAALSISLASYDVTPELERHLGQLVIRHAAALGQRTPGGPFAYSPHPTIR